jgi:hypothetical protein
VVEPQEFLCMVGLHGDSVERGGSDRLFNLQSRQEVLSGASAYYFVEVRTGPTGARDDAYSIVDLVCPTVPEWVEVEVWYRHWHGHALAEFAEGMP